MSTDADHVRQTLMKLSVAVREMTPPGTKQVSYSLDRFNLLVRPVYGGCRICGLPGHQSLDIQHPAACRVALLSLIGFWKDIVDHVSFLYQYSERFQKAIQANEPTYAMRLDNRPLKGGDMEVVLVDRLTGNFLKFLAHVRGIRAKVNLVLDEESLRRYERVAKNFEGFFLGGLTCKLSHELLQSDGN
jgi:CCR4-NOT transcription complex subunit 2